MSADGEKVIARLASIIGQGAAGLKLARALAGEGISTRRQLRKKSVLARLPIASRASVLYNPARSTPLAAAQGVAEELIRRLVFNFGPPSGHGGGRWLDWRELQVLSVGSIRRRAARVRDLDFLVVAPPELLDRALGAALLRPPQPGDRLAIADTYAAGVRRRGVIIAQKSLAPRGRTKHYRADLFATTPGDLPYALFHYTGSSDYTIRVRAHAKRNGMKLNQYGIYNAASGRRARGSAAVRTEADIARFLGITVRSPEDRIKTAKA
jgi:DNA polymerase (family 10)